MSPADISSPTLEQSLAQLHAQLAGASNVDERTRALLRPLLGDIERLLRDRAAGPGGAHGALATERQEPHRLEPHRLEGMAVEFETDHPSLAATLRQFIDLLGRAGL